LTLAVFAALVSQGAFAQDDSRYPGQDQYYLWGLAIGQSRSDLNEQRTAERVLPTGYTATITSRDARATPFRIFGGYQFSRGFGVELGYFNMGKFGFNSTTVPAGTLDGQLKLHGEYLDAVGTLPFSERWSGLGRVGASHLNSKADFSGSAASTLAATSVAKSTGHLHYGAGLQYELSPSVLLRGEIGRFNTNDAVGNQTNVSTVTVGFVMPFGRAPRPAPAPKAAVYVPPPEPMPEPVVVAAPPPPPPVVMAPPVKRRVTISAESLYGFDHSNLRPEGKAALDAFARDLQGADYSSVVVEGHTDRLGTTAYNQTLSEQRAEVVKAYLVSDGKLDPAKVSAVGKGETMPHTKPEDCKGKAPTPKLITCLQPDRRVEIEVTGTR
jgi:OOP family OmpA-OmpF porin